jgi:hypothetical protein
MSEVSWAKELGIDLDALATESPLHPYQLQASKVSRKMGQDYWREHALKNRRVVYDYGIRNQRGEMYTINEILTTATGEVIATVTSQVMTPQGATDKVWAIHRRNGKMGLKDGVTYRVELIEP